MSQFKLATKSSIFLLLICLSTSLTVGWISYINSKAALEAQTFDRLTAIQTSIVRLMYIRDAYNPTGFIIRASLNIEAIDDSH